MKTGVKVLTNQAGGRKTQVVLQSEPYKHTLVMMYMCLPQ